MNLDELREMLEGLTDRELSKYVRKAVCEFLSNTDNPPAETQTMLDILYTECARRGRTWIYDRAYEAVCKRPSLCEV